MDPKLLRQTVLLVSLPGSRPEVHVVCIDQAQRALSIREAAVQKSGEVALGVEKGISLNDIQSVDVIGVADVKVVTAKGKSGKLLVGLHTETPEEEKTWLEGLRRAISSNAATEAAKEAKDGSEGASSPTASKPQGSARLEMQSLQAKSRGLQTKIASLEALSDRRDRQLQKMMSRLDGAMQMLSAVQEMCQQQRSVIKAQRQAIVDLREDLGEGVEEEEEEDDEDDEEEEDTVGELAPSGRAAVQVRSPVAPESADADDDDGDEEDDGDMSEEGLQRKMQMMMSLLREADELQKVLQGLEAGGELDAAALQALSGLGSLSQLTSTATELGDKQERRSPVAAAGQNSR
mmetsp:Transcript_49119/g.114894  ORF Transcript_49119/g.114894 Transcript_49119/m.114894 type:complete len:348 (-) Transcript_49119:87-1130(-)